MRCLEEAFLGAAGRRLISFVIEQEPRGGLGGLFRSYPVDGHYAALGETGALKAEAFKSVRFSATAKDIGSSKVLRPSTWQARPCAS